MIYVPTYNDYVANNANRLNQALELSTGKRDKFKTIARTFFIVDYGYTSDTEAIGKIMRGDCLPLEVNFNKYIETLHY